MSLIINIILAFIAVIFLLLWLRERKHASEAEIVAYGLRAEDDSDDNTKTSISIMEAEFDDALEKLCQLGEIEQDNWGNWVWVKTGEPLGKQEP
jgi:cbb3-type cytochrome oxidase subunit 3